ncbi:RIIA lysis inhibitor [Vibrio phage D528]
MAVLRRKEYHVESNGLQGTQFQVKASAKMFETLMSTLYRHKEEAVVRELGCNANDAHKERNRMQRPLVCGYGQSVYENTARAEARPDLRWFAPRETTWELHVPTSINPYLEVKDFGIGLTVNQIMGYEEWIDADGKMFQMDRDWVGSVDDNGHPVGATRHLDEKGRQIRSGGMYTTLFDSTKEQANDQTGAFGLGSKSPFSIADSFTVESRVNGEKHMYLMYMSAARIPLVDWITKDDKGFAQPIPTTEFNGVTVKVTVQTESFFKVRSACEKVLKVFETKPVVEGHPICVQDIDRDNIIGQTYMQTNTSIHYAVSGDVAYPIEVDKLDPDIQAVFKKMRRGSYTFFPIGELNIPPSREDLSYDEFTLEAINRRLAFAADNVQAKILEEFETCKKSMYDTMMKYQEQVEIWGSELLKSVKFKTKTGQTMHLSKEMEMAVPREKTPSGNERDMFKMHLFRHGGDKMVKEEYGTQKINVKHVRNGIIMLLDTPRMYLKKALHVCAELQEHEDRGISNVYMVTPHPDRETTAKEVSEAFGNEMEVYLSSAIKPPKAKYAAGASSGLSQYTWGRSASFHSWDKVTPQILEDDILTSEKPWLYVEMNGFNPSVSMYVVQNVNHFFTGLGSETNPYAGVIGVRKSGKKVVTENPDMFVPLEGAREEFIKDELNALTTKERRVVQHIYATKNYDYSTVLFMTDLCAMLMPERLPELRYFYHARTAKAMRWMNDAMYARVKFVNGKTNDNIDNAVDYIDNIGGSSIKKNFPWITRVQDHFEQLERDIAGLYPDVFTGGYLSSHAHNGLGDIMDKIHKVEFLKKHGYKRGGMWVGTELNTINGSKFGERANRQAAAYVEDINALHAPEVPKTPDEVINERSQEFLDVTLDESDCDCAA